MNFIRDDITLEGEEPARLGAVIDSSLRVLNEQQFFSWVQGEVQYLLSHEILICGITSGAGGRMRCYRFSSTRYFRLEHFDAVCDPVTGLFTQMMSLTRKTGRPCVLGPGVSMGGCDESWLPLLDSCELRNVAAYGQRGIDGQLKSFFCFARIGDELCPRIMYLLEVLTPILDATFSRVVSQHGIKSQTYFANARSLSKREIEVLHYLMAGKTNQVIADDLKLSPLTIKNHVQNIMKKLKVKTRGHAVTTGFKLGLLMAHNETQGENNV
jgi:transcriptional regulator EpsA